MTVEEDQSSLEEFRLEDLVEVHDFGTATESGLISLADLSRFLKKRMSDRQRSSNIVSENQTDDSTLDTAKLPDSSSEQPLNSVDK
jgi:hypothetical protein